MKIKRVCQICGRVQRIDIFEDKDTWASFDLSEILEYLTGKRYPCWIGYDLHICDRCISTLGRDRAYEELCKILKVSKNDK